MEYGKAKICNNTIFTGTQLIKTGHYPETVPGKYTREHLIT
jgi:hypothetical protein